MPFFNDRNSLLDVSKGGTLVGSQGGLNFIQGPGIILTIMDDPLNGEVDVQIESTGGGGGEANTASNLGTGQGLFNSKVGVDLQFKSLTASSNKILLTGNANDVGIDVNPGNINLGDLANTNFPTPSSDRILFWDNSAGKYTFLTPGANLSITGTTLDASGGSGSPGGSSGQLQYNNAGSFDGTAGLTYATTGQLLTAAAQNATDVPLVSQGAASQSGNLLEFQDNVGTPLAFMSGDCTLFSMQRNMVIGGGSHGTTSTTQATVIGYGAQATAQYGTAVGDSAAVSGSEGLAVGVGASVTSAQGTALGTGASVSTGAGIAIGRNAATTGAVVIGANTSANMGHVLIGGGNTLTGVESSVIGGNSSVAASYSIGIGSGVSIPSGNNYSIAMGIFAAVTQPSQVAFSTLGDTLLTLQRDSSTGVMRDTTAIQGSWIDNTDASRTGRMKLGAYYTSTFQEAMRIDADSGGPKLGFFGTAAAAQQAGGSATAGVLYTSTEQTMLQTVYDALRAYGLLT